MSQIVFAFNKVQWASLVWRNQEGVCLTRKPKGSTVYGGQPVRDEIAYPLLADYPGETMEERAKRLGIIDNWTPVVKFRITANRSLTFEGDKALKLWKAWNGFIFGNK